MHTIKAILPDTFKTSIRRFLNHYSLPKKDPRDLAYCVCCGSTSISFEPVLWDKLIREWDLTEEEAAYINRQQGIRCKRCKSNLRSMAIAYVMMQYAGYHGLFMDYVKTGKIKRKKILEVNEAGKLTQFLKKIPGHLICQYPQVDIQDLPFPASSFDIVLHSDTLEHVPDPSAALKECRRVLKPGGYCIFTVPMVIGRLSRSRSGLPPSHHGSVNEEGDDYLVHTEFGADVWNFAMQAGFSEVRICSVEYPSGLAFLCVK